MGTLEVRQPQTEDELIKQARALGVPPEDLSRLEHMMSEDGGGEHQVTAESARVPDRLTQVWRYILSSMLCKKPPQNGGNGGASSRAMVNPESMAAIHRYASAGDTPVDSIQ